ncbi:MAG: hypothetical protein ABI377_11980 [Devosia sp.]
MAFYFIGQMLNGYMRCSMPVLMLVLIIGTTPAFAATDCDIYVDASLGGSAGLTLRFADAEHFTETIPGGGNTIDCALMVGDQTHGPYEARCRGRLDKKTFKDEAEFFHGPHQDGPQAMLFMGDLWYSECDSDIDPRSSQ